MKYKFGYPVVLLVIMVAIVLSNQVATAKLGPGNLTLNNHGEEPYEFYIPYVSSKYYWLTLDKWTPWAFHEFHLKKLHAGPEPGWLWVLTDKGLYFSKSYGLSWKRIDSNLPWVAWDFAVSQSTIPEHLIYAVLMGNIYSSNDGGQSWELEAQHDFETYFTFITNVNDVVYAATGYPPHVYIHREDNTWEIVGGGLEGSLQVLAEFQHHLYAGTTTGLYRLSNNFWQPVIISGYTISANPSIVNSIVIYGETIFIGTGDARGVYRSNDGVTWTACDTGLIGAHSHNVRSLVVSETGRLFAAGLDGVFVSDHLGDRWQSLDLGLPHTNTDYGVLLDGIYGTSLALVREEDGEQTLGAVFNGQGLRFYTITDEVLLKDKPPLNPPKAVLIVGPLDPPNHYSTNHNINWANRLANIMSQHGMKVVKIYWPESTWENVRPALSGASIVVYKGHGFGFSELTDDPTEMYGGLNGFCLVNPADSWGARLGTQDMLVTTNRLAENAIGFFSCCSCAGTSAVDVVPVSEALARRRIEGYSSTMLYMGGGGYFSGVNEEGILIDFFNNPDKTLGELYKRAGGDPDNVYSHILWPDISVWFDGNTQWGWSRAFVGNPNLTARDILYP